MAVLLCIFGFILILIILFMIFACVFVGKQAENDFYRYNDLVDLKCVIGDALGELVDKSTTPDYTESDDVKYNTLLDVYNVINEMLYQDRR